MSGPGDFMDGAKDLFREAGWRKGPFILRAIIEGEGITVTLEPDKWHRFTMTKSGRRVQFHLEGQKP